MQADGIPASNGQESSHDPAGCHDRRGDWAALCRAVGALVMSKHDYLGAASPLPFRTWSWCSEGACAHGADRVRVCLQGRDTADKLMMMTVRMIRQHASAERRLLPWLEP